jgi:putative component of toxin-antitoxin plasmid stabilization module
MSNFTLIEIVAIKGKQKFYKLKKDAVCAFDDFETEARINYNSEINRIYALMNKFANLETLTKKQFKDITPTKELIKEYEFKTHHLRVYAMKEANTGNIIITGGYKNSQRSDINHFREMKKMYIQKGSQ